MKETTIMEAIRDTGIMGVQSMSMARKCVILEEVKFNGKLITNLTQTVEIKEGSTLKIRSRLFTFRNREWK